VGGRGRRSSPFTDGQPATRMTVPTCIQARGRRVFAHQRVTGTGLSFTDTGARPPETDRSIQASRCRSPLPLTNYVTKPAHRVGLKGSTATLSTSTPNVIVHASGRGTEHCWRS